MTLNVIGIALYLFFIAAIEDIKNVLKTIDDSSKTESGRKQMYKQFAEFVDSHSTMKQLSYAYFVYERAPKNSDLHEFTHLELFLWFSFVFNI